MNKQYQVKWNLDKCILFWREKSVSGVTVSYFLVHHISYKNTKCEKYSWRYLTMECSVSNVEICNFAYTGQFDKLKQSILSDKSLACKTDQVKTPIFFIYFFWTNKKVSFSASSCLSCFRTVEPPCTGLVLLVTPTLWSFCLTSELKWIFRMTWV